MGKAKIHLFIVFLITILNILGRTWKSVPKYYGSLFFISFLNSLYYYLCKRHLVWEFRGLNWRVNRALHVFYVTPMLVLLFLSKMPSKLINKFLYLIGWLTGSFILEYFMVKVKVLKFKHGWSLNWSLLVYLKTYLYPYLFTKNKLLASLLSLCSAIFFILSFQVPISKRLLKGPFSFLIKNKPLFPFEISRKSILPKRIKYKNS